MIQCRIKLKPSKNQEATLSSWLPILTGVWNFAIRKIELNARDRIYFQEREFQSMLDGSSKKLGVSSHAVRGILLDAYRAWERCFKKTGGKPRLKGRWRSLKSIPFPDPIRRPNGNTIRLRTIGSVKFHRQDIPKGKIKGGRVCKRASGWFLCLFIDAQPNSIPRISRNIIGIDPGFNSLLTFSTGEKVPNPREFEASKARLGQAQRGKRKRLSVTGS